MQLQIKSWCPILSKRTAKNKTKKLPASEKDISHAAFTLVWFFALAILSRELKMCCGEGEILDASQQKRQQKTRRGEAQKTKKPNLTMCDLKMSSLYIHVVRFILKHCHTFMYSTPPRRNARTHSVWRRRKGVMRMRDKWNAQNVTTVHTFISCARRARRYRRRTLVLRSPRRFHSIIRQITTYACSARPGQPQFNEESLRGPILITTSCMNLTMSERATLSATPDALEIWHNRIPPEMMDFQPMP